ncbi:DUF2157 domain-containing protein [Mucilaginibacter polytrichastri]|uniref:DUF2157 domain-containing protein n=1 Tax=Mucilaginibacter polytrichastri TaxID=1302689 RepID=A0A1Q6A1W5_9SPHI|nr:DUF2157 domain-containing protein [Mucilaginibacter polytrichastri]OKS88003.1 hypothetical protein RG47T_3467 [Mucilaginibacter polytrichastri]SFT27095.1 hypothetical protein SAMN04487890_12714 [Mucilaginibacter polytrichastri]
MPKLNLDKQESEFLNRAIEVWEKDNLVDGATAEKLRHSYEVKGFDWMRLAKYSFWIALVCGGASFCYLIVNDAVINMLKNLYYTPDIVISILSGAAAAFLFFWGHRLERLTPERIFSNEAVVFTGILFTACCIAYLGKTFDNGSGHYSLLFLVSIFVYGFLGWRMDSRLIWLFSLISLGSWFGTETGYQTRWSDYFLGMNYPLRFVVFGALLVLACGVLRRQKWFNRFNELTYVAGLLYLFLSLWMLSIFGNYGNIDSWWHVKQISLFYWGIISAAVAAGFLLYGLKVKDVIAREFGITFLLIFIYTKYFEYFWDHTNKTLFFAILAASFWLIGRKAERIWNIKSKEVSLD